MKENRRKRLLELLDGPRFNGKRGQFYKEAGMTSGRLSQLLNPEGQFGDAAARNLVRKLGLPQGYFERVEHDIDAPVENSSLTVMAVQLGKMYDLIPEGDTLMRSIAYQKASEAILDVVQNSLKNTS